MITGWAARNATARGDRVRRHTSHPHRATAATPSSWYESRVANHDGPTTKPKTAESNVNPGP